jgi:hypothetical protein
LKKADKIRNKKEAFLNKLNAAATQQRKRQNKSNNKKQKKIEPTNR